MYKKSWTVLLPLLNPTKSQSPVSEHFKGFITSKVQRSWTATASLIPQTGTLMSENRLEDFSGIIYAQKWPTILIRLSKDTGHVRFLFPSNQGPKETFMDRYPVSKCPVSARLNPPLCYCIKWTNVGGDQLKNNHSQFWNFDLAKQMKSHSVQYVNKIKRTVHFVKQHLLPATTKFQQCLPLLCFFTNFYTTPINGDHFSIYLEREGEGSKQISLYPNDFFLRIQIIE